MLTLTRIYEVKVSPGIENFTEAQVPGQWLLPEYSCRQPLIKTSLRVCRVKASRAKCLSSCIWIEFLKAKLAQKNSVVVYFRFLFFVFFLWKSTQGTRRIFSPCFSHAYAGSQKPTKMQKFSGTIRTRFLMPREKRATETGNLFCNIAANK